MKPTSNRTPKLPALLAIAASTALLAGGLSGCTQRSSLGWAQMSRTIPASTARPAYDGAAPIGLAAYRETDRDTKTN